MGQYIDKSAVVAEIDRLKTIYNDDENIHHVAKYNILVDILSFLDTIEVKEEEEESVSNDLEDYAKKESESFAEREYEIDYIDRNALAKGYYWGVKSGAKWQKEHLCKPADGEDLPELEREVIVLYQPYPLEGSEYAVGFAHRPDPKGWDGTNIVTGKVEHYTPKTYDKGGWNSPNIKWWLDYKFEFKPKEE